ncbi:MAG: serralysin [Verrucomicrobiota bacterium]
MKTLTSCLVIVAAAIFVAWPLTTSAQTISSTVAQSGAFDSGIGGPGTNGSSGMNDPVPITGTTLNGITNPSANPYDFTGQNYAGLSSIDNIQVTLTVFDGNSGFSGPVEDFDFNNLTFGLAGFDTGIKLNGFSSASIDGSDITLTFFSSSISNAPQILAVLQATGTLTGSIIDATGLPDSNGMTLSSTHNTTLVINAVPEPSTWALLAVGAAGFAFLGRARKSRA